MPHTNGFFIFALSAQDVIRNLYKCTLRTLLVAWQARQARQAVSGVIKHGEIMGHPRGQTLKQGKKTLSGGFPQ